MPLSMYVPFTYVTMFGYTPQISTPNKSSLATSGIIVVKLLVMTTF